MKKKIISLSLCTLLLSSVCFSGAYASDGNENQVPAVISSFEEATGIFVNFIVKCFNKLTGKNEADIPEPEMQAHGWSEYEGEAIENPDILLSAETWLMNELTFESKKSYSDPFNDVDIELHLYSQGRLYKIPGFWDGENTWKIRFACPYEGVWYFKTVCTDEENSILHGRTGKVDCSAYSGNLDVYKHGFVTTDAGHKYFTYADGTPFFYLGDTHWSLGGESAEMVKIISEKRVSQGFTVIQSEPIDEKFDFADGITEYDMNGLHRYDEKFAIIADNGLTHANAQFFFPYSMELLINNFGGVKENGEMSDGVKAYLNKITRYWVARYGAYPVMWTLGQEIDNDFYWNDATHPMWNYKNNPYKLVAEYIGIYDAYDHPLTGHQENAGATAAYGDGKNADDKCKVYHKGAMSSAFRDVKEHSFYAAQWSPSKTEQTNFNAEKDFWYNSQGKPSINYEGQYCYLWTKNYGARMQGYLAFLNGMYGYGWGAHDTWSYLNIYDEENDSSDGVDTITSEEKINATWEDALEYASSYQVGYMRSFLEKTEWYNLIPRFDNKAYFVPGNNVYYVYASTGDNSEIVIYFYSFTDEAVAQNVNTNGYGGIKTGTVGSLTPGGEYSYQWFNPITGEYSEEYEFTATRFGTYYLGSRPDDTDMAVVIRAK